MKNMKAISIKQPWASLIVNGYKDIENRSWRTSYRGKILIHASSKPVIGGMSNLNKLQYNAIPADCSFNSSLYSAIIGSVEIVDCVKNDPSVWAEKGVWNWKLKNPVLFKNPILHVKGKLNLWNFYFNESCSLFTK